MRALDAVLLTLYAVCEAEARGGGRMPVSRMAIHGLVYLSSLKVDVDTWFYAHYYGPFSESVSMEIARLWGHGLVREDVHATRPSCTYSLTGGGRRLGERVAGENKAEYAKIASVVDECGRSCGLREPQVLFAAKSHYLRDRKGAPHAGAAKLPSMGRKIGWIMSEGDAGFGLGLLARLGLGGDEACGPRPPAPDIGIAGGGPSHGRGSRPAATGTRGAGSWHGRATPLPPSWNGMAMAGRCGAARP